MRIAFVQSLITYAHNNPKIILLTGDLGYSVFEEFIRLFPKQYINCGIAEQTMTGISAGLAMEGFVPVIYSIVPFITMRNFEQIRNDICYQNVNVKIVGVGAGFSYGPYGHTHHGLEDLGILRTIPNLTIIAPGDPVETEAAVDFMFHAIGPTYLRLGRAGEPKVHKKNIRMHLGKGIVIRKGNNNGVILATSTMVKNAVDTAEYMEKQYQISVTVISMPFIKPIDQTGIKKLIHSHPWIITLEEHSIIGGLGSAVAEIVAEENTGVSFKRIGVKDQFTDTIGTQEHMRNVNGLSLKYIAEEIQMMRKI